MPLNKEIEHYYSQSNEESRLSSTALGKFEKERTEILLNEYIPKTPCVIMDIGGGAGVYAFLLSRQGHLVHLIDPVDLHIEQAKKYSEQSDVKLASCKIGHAGELPYESDYADVVLMLGPLYHILTPQDRNKALNEAHRVLKQGGLLIAAGISRISTAIDCFGRGISRGCSNSTDGRNRH